MVGRQCVRGFETDYPRNTMQIRRVSIIMIWYRATGPIDWSKIGHCSTPYGVSRLEYTPNIRKARPIQHTTPRAQASHQLKVHPRRSREFLDELPLMPEAHLPPHCHGTHRGGLQRRQLRLTP